MCQSLLLEKMKLSKFKGRVWSPPSAGRWCGPRSPGETQLKDGGEARVEETNEDNLNPRDLSERGLGTRGGPQVLR